MRTILIALAGFAVVGGIGLVTFSLLPTADGGPLHPIQVNSPESIEPIVPTQRTASPTAPTTAQQQTPTQVSPAPGDAGGVPEPPPAIWRDDSPGDDGWDDDGWSGDDWAGDDDDDWGGDDGDDDWGDDDGGDDD